MLKIVKGAEIHSRLMHDKYAAFFGPTGPKTIVDLGANVGLYTCFLASFFPSSHVYAFEPDASNFSVLTENVKNNELPNVSMFNTGIGRVDSVTTQDMFYNPSRSENTGLYTFKKMPGFVKHSVCTLSPLTDFVPDHFETSDIVKIDIEGGEYDVIDANRQFFARSKMIFMEHNTSYDDTRHLDSLMAELGFKKIHYDNRNNYLWAK